MFTKKGLLITISILLSLYPLICILVYFVQEKLIFFPEKLTQNHVFHFEQPFEEIIFHTDGINIHGCLFKVENPNGLIFYLHGNAGSLAGWGYVAERYTELNYDVYIMDYPGYGKSQGSIKSKDQLLTIVQAAYDSIKQRYNEDSIIILGHSIGTGPAAWLASNNHPKQLFLHAPYYSLTDLMKKSFPVLPTFILKYTFDTSNYLKQCKVPVVIFHGTSDEVIYYGSSLKLQSEFKEGDTLITLEDQGHNGITDNPQYIQELSRILKPY